jgi:hypothetical protein
MLVRLIALGLLLDSAALQPQPQLWPVGGIVVLWMVA